MRLIFTTLFGLVMGASTGMFNLPLIPQLICCIPLGILAAILGYALANHLEKGMQTKNTLRQMMYKRLSPPSPRSLDILRQTINRGRVNVGGIFRLTAGTHYLLYENTNPDLSRFATANGESTSESARGRISLTQEDISQIRDMVAGETANGVIFYPENTNPDFRRFATANGESTPDISESVASGEIKSSGKSVSAEDVIARIDKELKENSQ